jgi:hypothetical protein
MKEKRFSFFADPQERKAETHAHCTHLQIALASPQTKICKRVQSFPTSQDKISQFTLESIFDECFSTSKEKLPLLFSETVEIELRRLTVNGEIGMIINF